MSWPSSRARSARSARTPRRDRGGAGARGGPPGAGGAVGGPVLELRCGVGLGVYVGDLLEFLRAFQRHGVAAHSPDIKRALGAADLGGQSRDALLLLEGLGRAVGQLGERCEQALAIGGAEV